MYKYFFRKDFPQHPLEKKDYGSASVENMQNVLEGSYIISANKALKVIDTIS